MNIPDPRHPYLSSGLIAYIGNKRNLLHFLGTNLASCASLVKHPCVMLDPFSGSGAVSRLGRFMGFSVGSNDIEYYAALIGLCRIGCDPLLLEKAFEDEGGSSSCFKALDAFAGGLSPNEASALFPSGAVQEAWLHAFRGAETADPYIARYYAPRNTLEADWRTERLFYTAENARYLDRAREAVEQRYTLDPLEPNRANNVGALAKAALVDALLYGAATHTNTSGVFKACHRGFGGHGKDALGRILHPISIKAPVLVEGPPSVIGNMDATEFCSRRGADIAYLDPPYNQHQYGSNYHLLTTIARWDKPLVSQELDSAGMLANRSGIRRDWVNTRSDFCSKPKVYTAFKKLLESIDSRFVLLSYNDGGFLDQEQVVELFASQGQLRIELMPYTAYRGGKQSASRVERTKEFLFILDRRESSQGKTVKDDPAYIREALLRRRLLSQIDELCQGRFHPHRMKLLKPEELTLRWDLHGERGGLLLELHVNMFSTKALEDLAHRLKQAACTGYDEELSLVVDVLETLAPEDERVPLLAEEALMLLGKITFKKYSTSYEIQMRRLKLLLAGGQERFTRSLTRLSRLEEVARKRGL